MSPASPNLDAATVSTAGAGEYRRADEPQLPRQRPWLAAFLFTPFKDIDERVRIKR